MEITTILRLGAQVALVGWCVAESITSLLSRRRVTANTGVRWKIAGLMCFAAWMFLSALTIRDSQLFPRGDVVWIFSLLEVGAAAGAWGYWVTNTRHSFRFTFRVRGLSWLL